MTKPIEKALAKLENRFLLTTVVARRWENLTAGAPPLVEARKSQSKITTVLEEVIADRLTIDPETRSITLAVLPEVEVHDEPLFSEAFPTEPEKGERTRRNDR